METQLKKGKSAIYSTILKHGLSDFSLEILEYCNPSFLLEREKWYFGLLLPPDSGGEEYNLAKEPSSPMLGRTFSEESKTKISSARIGKTLSVGAPNKSYNE